MLKEWMALTSFSRWQMVPIWLSGPDLALLALFDGHSLLLYVLVQLNSSQACCNIVFGTP